jgi:hypothetical protein
VENGATKAKGRFMEMVGCKFVSLNYQDWKKAKPLAIPKVKHG